MRASTYVDALRETLCADLDFHGTDGNYGPHAWHPFPAKFPPQLPNFLIKQLSKPGDVVLDPMLGSGTTLVEAVRLGRRAIGCDIDPLARMIARAKLTPIDPSAALQTGLSVLSAAQNDCWQDGYRLRQDFLLRFDGKTADFIDYWFLPQHQIELFSLLLRIEELPEGSIRAFLNVVFSSTIIAKSGGVSLARDLAHTRPHRDTKKVPGSTFIEFAKRLERNVAAVGKSGAARDRSELFSERERCNEFEQSIPSSGSSRGQCGRHWPAIRKCRFDYYVAAIRQQRDRLHARTQILVGVVRLGNH